MKNISHTDRIRLHVRRFIGGSAVSVRLGSSFALRRGMFLPNTRAGPDSDRADHVEPIYRERTLSDNPQSQTVG